MGKRNHQINPIHTLNKVITAFGTAFLKPGDPLYGEIESIGTYIAGAGMDVCSGGYGGSMEAISKGAKMAGGFVTGITVKGRAAELNPYVDNNIAAENLMDRIIRLINIADAYIIFKGGTGTLLEISATLELMNKKAIPEKFLIFYGSNWKEVVSSLKDDSEYLTGLLERNVRFIKTPEEITEILNIIQSKIHL